MAATRGGFSGRAGLRGVGTRAATARVLGRVGGGRRTHPTPATGASARATTARPPRSGVVSRRANGTTGSSPTRGARHSTPTPSPSAAVRCTRAPTLVVCSAAPGGRFRAASCGVGGGAHPTRPVGLTPARPAAALVPARGAPHGRTRSARTRTGPRGPATTKGADCHMSAPRPCGPSDGFHRLGSSMVIVVLRVPVT